MNKKIMSFVLAMVLSAGLGVSTLFAYTYTGGTKHATSFRVNPQDMANLAGNIKTEGYDGTEDSIAAANDVTSRICAVFNYTAGMVTSAVDADRNITIYDQGRYRATLGYNDDGTYTITSFAVYGTDYSRIQQAGGLKNFLLAMGVSETALKCSKTETDEDGNTYFVDEDGNRLSEEDLENGKTAAQVDVDWLSQAEKQLAKGINHSITINFTAQYGASVTYSVNGKQMETIAYDGTQIAQYNYNSAGTLETIDQLTYETDTSDVTGHDSETNGYTTTVKTGGTSTGGGSDAIHYTVSSDGKVKVAKTTVDGKTTTTAEVTVTYTGKDGLQHEKKFTLSDVEEGKNGKLTGKIDGQTISLTVDKKNAKATKTQKGTTNTQDSILYKATKNVIHCDAWGRQSYVTNADGIVTGRYSYSSNGSITSSYDAATNNVTYYTGGKASFVMNDAGFITTRYFYHENGSLDGVMSYNFDADKEHGNYVEATSMTAYRWGNVIGSANLADIEEGQPKTFDQLRAAIDFIKANPDKAIASLKEGAKLTEGEIAQIQNIHFSDVSEEEDEDDDDKDKDDALSDADRKLYNKIMSTNTSVFGNITSIAIYKSDLSNTALMNAFGVNAADIANMAAMSNGYSAVGNLALTIDVLDFETTAYDGTTTTKATASASMGSHTWHSIQSLSTKKNTTTTKNGMVGQQLKATLTVMDHGGQSYQANCTPITLREAVNQEIRVDTEVTGIMETDPVVAGTLVTDKAALEEIAKTLGVDASKVSVGEDGVITVTNDDGTTSRYVAVKDAELNMMEGSGFFKLKEGETMLVDIGDSDVEQFKSGDKVMFMGDVAYTGPNNTGALAIKMKTEYGGGFKTFKDEDAMKAEMKRIENVANSGVAEDPNDQWIITNTNINSAKLGKDIEKLMNGDGTVSVQDLREAWNHLMF